MTGFDANDRTFELSLTQNSEISQQLSSGVGNKFNSPGVGDKRELTGTGIYDLTYAVSEFDLEDDFTEVEKAKEDKG